MADVFISYHMKSAGGLVREIADELESAGISCWYAERDMPLEETFSSQIPKEIRACRVFLLVWDRDCTEHVENEVSIAFERRNNQEKIALVTFKVDDCDLSDSVRYYLGKYPIINAFPSSTESIQILVNKIRETLYPDLAQPRQSANSTPPLPLVPKIRRVGGWLWSGFSPQALLILAALSLLLLFFLISFISSALPKSHTPSWYLAGDTLTVFDMGEAETSLYSMPDSPWFWHRDTITTLVITPDVKTINSYAFQNFSSLKSVDIPDSVTEIGAAAFEGCTALTSVVIPDSVKKIGKRAFENCGNLTSASVPEGLDITGVFPDNTTITFRPTVTGYGVSVSVEDALNQFKLR